MELVFEKMHLSHWVQSFKDDLKLQNLILMKHVQSDELAEVMRSNLMKAYDDGGCRKFWGCLRDIPDLVTVLQNVTSLSRSALQIEFEKEIRSIFTKVNWDYPFWISQISKWLNIDSIWQLNTVEAKQFDVFLKKSTEVWHLHIIYFYYSKLESDKQKESFNCWNYCFVLKTISTLRHTDRSNIL